MAVTTRLYTYNRHAHTQFIPLANDPKKISQEIQYYYTRTVLEGQHVLQLTKAYSKVKTLCKLQFDAFWKYVLQLVLSLSFY